MFLNNRSGLLLLACIVCLGPGCFSMSSAPTTARAGGDAKLTIVTTTAMIADAVRAVAGERAEVTALMSEGADPHLYSATRDDIARVLEADIVFYNGLHLEGRMQPALERAVASGTIAYAVGDAIPKKQLRFPGEFEGHPDPHVWQDPTLWRYAVDDIAEKLSKHEPEHATRFHDNAHAYQQQLVQLDEYARTCLGSIPEQQRWLVTAHDAFGYFSRTYGLRVRSVQGITTESQPGTRDINTLVDLLVENKIPAIFVEATVNEQHIRALIEGAAHRGWQVKIGGTLFSDSLGTKGSYQGTYVGMLDANITTITHALGGNAPEQGMQGKLSQP